MKIHPVNQCYLIHHLNIQCIGSLHNLSDTKQSYGQHRADEHLTSHHILPCVSLGRAWASPTLAWLHLRKCVFACLQPYTVNFKWVCLNFNFFELIYSTSWWAKPKGLFLECSVGYLELRRLKLKYTWQFTLCLLQIINGRLPTGKQIKFRSQRWLRSLHWVRAMH